MIRARGTARGRWRAPARWATLVLLDLALTVMHLAVATSAPASQAPPTRASQAVALPGAHPPAAQAPSGAQPHPCHECAEGHSAAGMGHLCSAVLAAVLLAAGVRWARRRLPALDHVVGGRGAGPPLLVPALVASPPWTHPTLERLCVRRA